MFSYSGLKYASVHEQNMCGCVCVCVTFYLVLLALSADLSQALECECEKHALAVSLSSASQPGTHTHTHTPKHTHTSIHIYMLTRCVNQTSTHTLTHTYSSLHLMSVLADPCQLWLRSCSDVLLWTDSLLLHWTLLSLAAIRGSVFPTSNLMNQDCWKLRGDLPKLSPWVCGVKLMRI